MNAARILRLLFSVLFAGVLGACASGRISDPYAVMIPEDPMPREAVRPPAPVRAAAAEASPEEPAPRASRGWFGRKRAAAEATDAAEQTADPEGNTALVDPASLPDRYLLRVGDQLEIHITGSGLDEVLQMPVDENGMVKFRFIGSVPAAGRTLAELEGEIELEYTERQQIYREVFVRVNVPYTFYFIGGEVRQPGRYPITGRTTLSQAIVAAGNFTEWARRDGRLTILRNQERITVNFRSILEDPSRDIELRTGDVITVERSFL
jgi:protein involved in polysaccharide export with SLBB domain